MTAPPADQAEPSFEPIELRYRWQADEHKRFYRILRSDALRRSRHRLAIKAFVLGAVIYALYAAATAPGVGTGKLIATLPYFLILAFWAAFYRWWMPAASARAYERAHAGAHEDEVRRITPSGVETECATSTANVRWSGIQRAPETDEFFLLFTSPGCAMQLPKRAIDVPGGVDRVRGALRSALGERAEIDTSNTVKLKDR